MARKAATPPSPTPAAPTAAAPAGVAARAAELHKQLEHHNYKYYVEDSPEISDLAYDALFRELVQIEKDHPDLATPDSPTQRVGGAPVSKLESVTHRQPMYSIGNTVGAENLREFAASVRKLLGNQKVRWTVEPKIDGAAISLTYVNGALEVGATRGDGKVGDDVTHNLRTIPGIPLKLRTANPPALFEVRGEVYMSRADFARLNDQARAEGSKVYANPRNTASATVRMLDPKEVARRKLRLMAYSLGAVEGIDLHSHVEVIKTLKEFGFPVPEVRAFDDFEQLIKYCAEWDAQPEPGSGQHARRFSLPFDIDGLVIKVDDLEQREQLGATAKDVRWATAFKFTAEQGITKVLDVVIHVGKFGEQTPVLTLEPVQLCGTTVKHVSMHNAAQMKERDVRIGDTVVVVKRGEIIPYVEQSLAELRTGKEVPYVFPKQCPACGAPVQKNESGNAYLCTNVDGCPAQLARRIEKFGMRSRMDILGLGRETAEALIDSGLVRTVADLFKLTERDLLQANIGMAELSARNLVNGIESSKTRGLGRLLAALNIPTISETFGPVLAKALPSIDLLLAASKEQLAMIEGFGPKRAEAVYNFFHSPSGEKLVADLKAAGVKMTEDAPKTTGAAVLAGKTVVATGALVNYKRDEIERRIVELGGKASGSVSKNTSFVIAGSGSSTRSKLEKAKELGVKVLSEEQFEEMVKELQAAAGPAQPLPPQPPLPPVGEGEQEVVVAAPATGEALAGKTVVVTGELQRDRKEMEALIARHGGKVASAVSKGVDLVVAGEAAGAKLTKARELGVRVVSEEEFEKLLTQPAAAPAPTAPVAAAAPAAPASGGKLAGLTIVVTGKLENYDRRGIEALIEQHGGKPSSSVNKATSFLVAGSGDSARSKLSKAQELGVKTLTEAQFEALLRGDEQVLL